MTSTHTSTSAAKKIDTKHTYIKILPGQKQNNLTLNSGQKQLAL